MEACRKGAGRVKGNPRQDIMCGAITLCVRA